jgi:hypothetical protein
LFVANPLVIVTPEMLFEVPLLRANTLTALSPPTFKSCIPGPLNTVFPVTAGSVDARLMLPVTVISMRSSPGAAFASRIACRREPGPASAVEETVKVAANRRALARATTSEINQTFRNSR